MIFLCPEGCERVDDDTEDKVLDNDHYDNEEERQIICCPQ